MQLLAVYNFKGGVGKTTTAVTLAHMAARQGWRTLFWDLDPQGAATYCLRVEPRVKGGGKGVIKGKHPLTGLLRETDYTNLDLLPADFSYRRLDKFLEQQKQPQAVLSRLLKPLKQQYELLVLDCPPSISYLAEAIFTASSQLLIPLLPSPLSLHTYRQLKDFLYQNNNNRPLAPFLTMVDRRRQLHKDMLDHLPQELPELLPVSIPYASMVEKMTFERQPLTELTANHPAAQAYQELWQHMRQRLSDTS